ncbi:MAG: hypothetical protein CME70_04440 [Halobacteriovorax sp.]|nr:hypothetical protein [Halobacteriovorax sp.]
MEISRLKCESWWIPVVFYSKYLFGFLAILILVTILAIFFDIPRNALLVIKIILIIKFAYVVLKADMKHDEEVKKLVKIDHKEQYFKKIKENDKYQGDDDWRIGPQSIDFNNLKLYFRQYSPQVGDDHDHCDFCGEKFSIIIEEALKEGYVTENGYPWVCKQCYEDFKERFNLTS